MKILTSFNLELSKSQIDQIESVSENVEVLISNSEGEAIELMPDIDVVFGDFTKDMFKNRANLRWVQATSAGVDHLLHEDFVKSDIIMTSSKGIVGSHLADHAMALLLSLSRGIYWAIRNPSWDQRKATTEMSWELQGKTIGIVGFGGTGQQLALRASGFGMSVVAVDPEVHEHNTKVECWKMNKFDNLLSVSDVVVICAPLTPETEGMFDSKAFKKMKSHAVLINVTRGSIVNESALVEALENGFIKGAGLDVVPQEPLPNNHVLWNLPNVIITPHSAGGSPHRLDRSVDLFCSNLKSLIESKPLENVIDKSKGY